MRPEPVTQWGPDNQPGDPTVMALGDRIKTLRTEAGWSQAELAEHVGGDGRQISRYENGRITSSLDALIRLAEALNTSLDYLVFDNQPRRPLDAPTNLLDARLTEAAELDDEDQRALLDHLDALLTRTRLRTITGGRD